MKKVRPAIETDALAIIQINIDGWKKTYKDIFPSTFLDELNNKKDESIINVKRKLMSI